MARPPVPLLGSSGTFLPVKGSTNVRRADTGECHSRAAALASARGQVRMDSRGLAARRPGRRPAARAARDGALIATPVHSEAPGGRVRWQRYDGQPRGSRLIRMAPWFDDGSLSVTVQARYYWHDTGQAHREVERGHTQGKLALIVDDDLAAGLEI